MKHRIFYALVSLALLTNITPFSAHAARATTFPKPLAEKPAVTVAPHRAIYTMTTSSIKNGSSIADVTGRMLFEWADACDGWAVQQHLHMHCIYAEGDEGDVNSAVISWESKDGERYNFNVRRLTNDKETESFRGRAVVGKDGGAAKYAIPKDKKDVVLPAGTVFPSAHTFLIIEKGLEGEKLFTRRVFDGSDEDSMADVSAFIGKKIEPSQALEMNAELAGSPLLNKPAWPVRLAFFKPETETGEPDYEMDLVMQENGIVRSMLIDYGEFSVTGKLSSLESLSAEACK